MLNSIISSKVKIIIIFLFSLIIVLVLILFIKTNQKKLKEKAKLNDKRIVEEEVDLIKKNRGKSLFVLSPTQFVTPPQGNKYKEAIKITIPPEIAKNYINSEQKLKIAEDVIDWLIDLKQNEDGELIFSVGYICNPGKPCEKTGTDRQLTFPVIWSMYHYYLKTKKQSILNDIKEIILSFSNTQTQPNFWHCRVLYDLYQSNDFSPSEKEKIKTLCLDGVNFDLPVIEPFIEKSRPESFNAQQIINKINDINQGKVISDQINIKDEWDFIIYSANISNFVYRYYWFKEPRDLQTARTYFDHALAYYQNNQEQYLSGLPIMIIGALDLYEATKNPEYLTLAKYLYQKNLEKETVFKNKLNQITFFMLLEKKMYDVTKEEKYNSLLSSHIKFVYDSYYHDKKGFCNFANSCLGYDTLGNALLNYILVR